MILIELVQEPTETLLELVILIGLTVEAIEVIVEPTKVSDVTKYQRRYEVADVLKVYIKKLYYI